MRIEPLDLQHQQLLCEKFSKFTTDIALYSFAILYLRRMQNVYEVCFSDIGVSIRGKMLSGERYVLPLDPISIYSKEAITTFLQGVDSIFPIAEGDVAYCSALGFSLHAQDDETEYLCKKERIATYSGRHLQSQRNQVLWLVDEENVAITPFDARARLIVDEWQAKCGKSKEDTDYFVCVEAIEKKELLKLEGFIVTVNDNPLGMILWEQISQQTIAIHFAKVSSQIKGLYPYMFQQVALRAPKSVQWINFEEDLNENSLRQAKRAYHPDRLLKKYHLTS